MPKNNRLIKKLLNLKEDYVLDLNEGSDNEELNVLREASMEEFLSFVNEVNKEFGEEISKKDPCEVYTNYFIALGKLPAGSKLSKEQLAAKIIELYGKGGTFNKSSYDKDIDKAITRCVKQALIDKVKKEHSNDSNYKIEKDGTVYVVIDKGGKQGKMNLTKMLMEDLDPNDIEAWEDVVQDNLPAVVKAATEGKTEEAASKEDNSSEKKKDTATEVEDEYEEYKEAFRDMHQVSRADIGAYEFKNTITFNPKDLPTKIEKDSGYINGGQWVKDKQEGPIKLLKSLRSVLMTAVDCFSLNEDVMSELSGDEKEEKKEESFRKENNNLLTEAGGSIEPPKEAEADGEDGQEETPKGGVQQSEVKTINFADIGQVIDDLKATSTARGGQVSQCLKILRTLIMDEESTGNFGEAFRNSGIFKDVIKTYACIIVCRLANKYNPIFKAGLNKEVTAEDPKLAYNTLKGYSDWVNNSPEINYFIREGGLAQSLETAEPALGQLAQYLAAMSNAIVTLQEATDNDAMVQNAVTWQKTDMANAKKVFDSLLKDKLSTCFDEVLKGEFETSSGQKAPIVNYMFDVEIPRRVKQAMNKEFDSFDEFIQKYYDPSIKDSQLSKNDILQKYFDQKAEKKYGASKAYKDKDGNAAAEAASKEDTTNTEDFNKLKQTYEVKKSQGSGEEGSENEKPSKNEPPKEKEENK